MVVLAPTSFCIMRQLIVVHPDFRNELGMVGLRDMIDRNLGTIVSEEDCTFIEVDSDEPLWRRGQFTPREVLLHLRAGELITDVADLHIHRSQRLAVARWNALRA